MVTLSVICIIVYLIIVCICITRRSNFNSGINYSDLCNDNLEGDLRLKGELSDKQMCKDWIMKHFPEYTKFLPRTYFKTTDMNELYEYLTSFVHEKFVLKNTHGSGMNIIVDDSRKMDARELVKKSREFLNTCFHCGDTTRTGRLRTKQKHYKYNNPQIIIEEYIGENPLDYKFHIIDGEVKFFQVDKNRRQGAHYRDIYSPMGEFIDGAYISKKKNSPQTGLSDEIMGHLPFMKKMSIDIYNKVNTLATQPLRLLRVDYFFANGRPYLGELTFSHGMCKEKFKGIPGIV